MCPAPRAAAEQAGLHQRCPPAVASAHSPLPHTHTHTQDDQVGSVTAALARSVVIRKIIMLPKLKAAALFQPEDHVASNALKRTHILKRRTTWVARNLSKGGISALHYGGIFGSGTLLFVGQEYALECITGEGEHSSFRHFHFGSSFSCHFQSSSGYTLSFSVTYIKKKE